MDDPGWGVCLCVCVWLFHLALQTGYMVSDYSGVIEGRAA